MLRRFLAYIYLGSGGNQSRTVRYAFPVMIISAVILSIASVISSTESSVTITTPSKTLVKDEEFYITVTAKTHVAVNAVDIQITYPESALKIEGIDTGTSVITLWTEEPYAKDGLIYLRGGTFRKGFIGEHTIARIKARAIGNGDAKILIKDLQLVAGDGSGTPVKTSQSKENNEIQLAVTTDDSEIKAKAEIKVATDTDGDGDVDLTDISVFMGAWFNGDKIYDFNGDGRMTFRDFSIILAKSFTQ